ncbi:OmpP1/FadL family transporter [Mesoterricola silvestris]|uniref:Membrane protein n=1 Tax=Mesoterricola silvestris TaxID=2927979 RepID=A0AA48K981_9BACT|nr:outer membrane protein transport protein [Mesoterricola silvestris]BDU72052.1 membrane protein [Mesoterricola silvestris]
MTNHSRVSLSASAVALLLVAAAPHAMASGFQLREQGASGQGLSYAGVSAGSTDIGGMFYNPAVLTRFEGNQVQLGFTNILPSTKFSNGAASRAGIPAASPFSAISGPAATGNAALSAVTPNVYAMWSLGPNLKAGFSVNVPYGLTTQYDDNWIGRYHALRSHLETLDITPTVAYRFNDMWSGGVSFVARRAKAELSQAVDFGYEAYMGVAQLAPAGITNTNPLTGGPVVYPGAADGKVSVTGDSWAYGFKAGLLFEPTKTLSVGLGYQSAITEKIKGDATFAIPSTVPMGLAALYQINPGAAKKPYLDGLAAAFAAGTANGPVTAELNLPAVITLGLNVQVSPTVTLSAEVERTQWSKFQELRLKFSNPATQADNITPENWKDSTFASVGATLRPGDGWTWRVGLAMDTAPVDDTYRTPRIPDADRTWISAGTGYQFSKAFTLDFGYTHIIAKDSTVNLKGGTNPLSSDYIKGNLSGTFKNAIDIWALQARWSF